MTISAVLLAGGESSRMGQDKATLLFRAEPLWKIQLDLLRQLQPVEIFVSAQIDPIWRPVDLEFVPDEQPSRGPLSGIIATLSSTATEHLLVLAIDVPFMNEKYLQRLAAQCESGQGVVPMIGDRAEPLVAVYPRDAASDFRRASNSDEFSLQPVVRRLIEARKLRPINVPPDERSLFRNLNEPQDLSDR